jgi:hypothetical protein
MGPEPLTAGGRSEQTAGRGDLAPAFPRDLDNTPAANACEQPNLGRQLTRARAMISDPILRLPDQHRPLVEQR